MILASWYFPIGAAIFIILFDLYWLVKTVYLSIHLRANWKRMRHHMKIDWKERVSKLKSDHVWQLVILPFYKEPFEVSDGLLSSVAGANWPKERAIVVLAREARAGESAKIVSSQLYEKYKNIFPHLLEIEHPADLPNEIPGKGSNTAWAGKKAQEYIDKLGIPHENILASSLDIDTQVLKDYFLVLTYYFLTVEDPEHTSYQPVPLYNNNIWEAPAFSRVVANSGSFWQMMQQERPERLATFSSHSMSFKALVGVGFWQKNMVSEDSRIFWMELLNNNGNYRSIPLSYPVYMDANVGRNIWETIRNVYKQQRRWAWGAENFPYTVFGFLKNKKISLKKRLYFTMIMIEGLWSWSTNALLMFFLGWLPLTLGGEAFNNTVLAFNLPRATRLIMTFAMIGIVTSILISTSLLPPPPPKTPRRRYVYMVFQWLLMPLILIIFGAIPALDAQTRLMLGRYMGFWVTPKYRKEGDEKITQNAPSPIAP
jgi:hypothetical protein